MGVKFRADWISESEQEYRVEIHDSSYVGSVIDFNIGMDSLDGFTLSYSGENSKRSNPILASSCIVNMAIETATQETFISDLVDADEDRFYIVIYKDNKGSWGLFWCGVVLQDMISQEDNARPYLFQLDATDGLGRLKDHKYPTATAGTYETFIEYIIACLNEIPTVQFWPTADMFLKTVVNWYEDSQFTTAPADALDPLAVSRVANDAFMYKNDLGATVAKTCYEVLSQIANQFNCVLKQVNGFFYFFQINEAENPTVCERSYKSDGTYYGVEPAKDYLVTSFDREGYYAFLPMLQKVSIKYEYKQSFFGYNLLPDQTDYSTDVVFGEIQGGADEFLIFSGHVKGTCDIGSTGWDSHHRWVYALKIRVGSYYLTNEDGNMSWSTTATKRVYLKTTFYHTTTGGYTYSFPFGFITPAIPGSGTGLFGFDFDHLEDLDGNTVSAPPGVSLTFICKDFELNLDMDDSFTEGTIEYSATNSNSGTAVKATSIDKLPTTLLGDGPDDYSDGAIQVYDTSAWGNSDEEWTVGGVGVGTNINKLLCREYMAGQNSARRVYIGSIWADDITAISILELNGDNYMMRGGTFNANTNVWEGEWFQVIVDRTGITVQDDKLEDPVKDISKSSGHGYGNLKLILETDNLRNQYYIKGKKTLVTSSYTLDVNDHIIYVNPAAATILTMPASTYSENFTYIIVNKSTTSSVTIAIPTGESLDGTVNGTYSLAASTSVTMHNSGISSVGWAFLGKRSPK